MSGGTGGHGSSSTPLIATIKGWVLGENSLGTESVTSLFELEVSIRPSKGALLCFALLGLLEDMLLEDGRVSKIRSEH